MNVWWPAGKGERKEYCCEVRAMADGLTDQAAGSNEILPSHSAQLFCDADNTLAWVDLLAHKMSREVVWGWSLCPSTMQLPAVQHFMKKHFAPPGPQVILLRSQATQTDPLVVGGKRRTIGWAATKTKRQLTLTEAGARRRDSPYARRYAQW